MPILLSHENQKLGDETWSWSIPAVQTCPGSTDTCRRHCYARQFRFCFPGVRNKLARNVRFAREPGFWREIVAEIEMAEVRLLRIHAAGDFFSPEYVDQWIRIAKACPDTTMWTYTRSWRKKSIRNRLRVLARQPNVVLYWSCDKDTGLPNRMPEGVRTAYLQTALDDVPAAPVDLVFRTRNIRKVIAEEIETPGGESPVCPTETGLPDAHDHHCSTCRACFTPIEVEEPEPGRRRTPLVLV